MSLRGRLGREDGFLSVDLGVGGVDRDAQPVWASVIGTVRSWMCGRDLTLLTSLVYRSDRMIRGKSDFIKSQPLNSDLTMLVVPIRNAIKI